ncbi:KdsC family phosphatase [Melioribacteraceae bacterium 4301-Me]|uniref:KdsC family phosphatase n=1 Tax=Pyranulibacter aquaticus TaxID=3163344 RepID=UPI003598719C
MAKKKLTKKQILNRAKKIKLLLTDCDGVLTDTGVYYSHNGEVMKRFSVRDGMGVERLRQLANVEVGILTGENTGAVKSRAQKLKLNEVHLGALNKAEVLKDILQRRNLTPEEIAFIGDDANDVEIMKMVGLTACPADATKFALKVADIVVESKGGYGAFRDFAELIIEAKQKGENK